MSENSRIEWTDTTWNPVRGCSRVSAGCEHCYAERQAHRFSGPGKPYEGLTVLGKKGPRWNGEVRLVHDVLGEPLRWRKPRLVFVNSMSDLFHEDVPFEFIAAVFGVMAAAPQHTFQLLTKRPRRAREFFTWIVREATPATDGGYPSDPDVQALAAVINAVCETPIPMPSWVDEEGLVLESIWSKAEWPLQNVWLLTSIEDQATADERIPEILRCPAAVRGVSYEPALGPVDFSQYLPAAGCVSCGWDGGLAEAYDATPLERDRALGISTCPSCGSIEIAEEPEGLDWLIVGGESGPGARPFNVARAHSTIAQTRRAGVACFVKQLGRRPYTQTAYGRTPCSGHGCGDGDLCTAHERHPLKLRDRKGGDWSEWPADLRVREYPGGYGD